MELNLTSHNNSVFQTMMIFLLPEICFYIFKEHLTHQVVSIKSIVTAHHKLMSEIRTILKSVAKVRFLFMNKFCEVFSVFITEINTKLLY